jgi:hypothetical protein
MVGCWSGSSGGVEGRLRLEDPAVALVEDPEQLGVDVGNSSPGSGHGVFMVGEMP